MINDIIKTISGLNSVFKDQKTAGLSNESKSDHKAKKGYFFNADYAEIAGSEFELEMDELYPLEK